VPLFSDETCLVLFGKKSRIGIKNNSAFYPGPVLPPRGHSSPFKLRSSSDNHERLRKLSRFIPSCQGFVSFIPDLSEKQSLKCQISKRFELTDILG